MKIRKATRKDYKKIAEIYRLCFTKKDYNEVWTQSMTLKKINFLSRYCDIFVTLIDKKIIGFVAVNPSKWYVGRFADIEEIGIGPKYQNRGYGKQLLKFIEDYYKKKDYSYLIFTVNKTSKAYRKYKKMGYSEDKNGALFMKDLKRKAKLVSFITNKKSNEIKFYQKQGYKMKKERIVMEKLI
ncbi:MAG: GNAT family N-acetyltransferase [Nanoarchaeota archaeon]|nr:GNAT family N-acetyltransferase [Nanoarchaeota archaeon]